MEWDVWAHVRSESHNPRDPIWHYKFEAKNLAEAKVKLLTSVRKRVARLRTMEGRWIQIQAIPRLKDGKLDGTRMLRVRDSFSDKRILSVANPNLPFVYGYGPKQAQQLST